MNLQREAEVPIIGAQPHTRSVGIATHSGVQLPIPSDGSPLALSDIDYPMSKSVLIPNDMQVTISMNDFNAHQQDPINVINLQSETAGPYASGKHQPSPPPAPSTGKMINTSYTGMKLKGGSIYGTPTESHSSPTSTSFLSESTN